MKTIVLASTNSKKLEEMKLLMKPMGWLVETPTSLKIEFCVEETGNTFEENAKLKSQTLFHQTGIPSLADDSGICVEALGGEPGIYSARYGEPYFNDQERALYLLHKMKNYINRRVKYVCALSFTSELDSKIFLGECHGILEKDYDYKGKFGFGYDPIFYYPELGSRFSRISSEVKNKVSHRGIALQKFIEYMKIK